MQSGTLSMQNHNQAGKRQDFHRPSQGSPAHRNQRPQQPFNHLVIPDTVEEAVVQYDRDHTSYIRLRGFGGINYMSVGRVLVIAHDDSSVCIDSVVLPLQYGPVARTLTLRRENLRIGDHYEVITIHKCASGVWFVRQEAQGYHPHSPNFCPATNHFPVIREHLGSRHHGESILHQLETFTGIQFGLGMTQDYKQYMEKPLGEYHDMHQLVNDELEEARKALNPVDIKQADDLICFMQRVAGYVMPPGSTEAVIEDQERVDEANHHRVQRQDSIGQVAASHQATLPKPVPEPVVVKTSARPAWMDVPLRGRR